MKRILPAVLAALIWTAAGWADDPASLSGRWKLHSNIQGHENDFDCTLTQKDKEVTGTCKAGDTELPISGTVSDTKVVFQYKAVYEGQELTVVHEGKLETPAKLIGIVDVQPMGVSGEFIATR